LWGRVPRADRELPRAALADPDPDQAWKALALVNEWLRHAETKLAATLAASGVAGGVLFNLVKDESVHCLMNVVVTLACVAILAAGTCAMVGLYPIVRLGRDEEQSVATANPLYFGDVARVYRNDTDGFLATLRALTMDREDLVRRIAHQVHANATVAARKYKWAHRSLRMLLLALPLIGVVAILRPLAY
jgi:hypothetical protein